VGSASMRRVDVRILASTNRDLPTLIREGKFREDLFYRLNVIPIVIPPLRERTEDIVPLCRHFLTMYGSKLGREPQSLSSEALEVILGHGWPGNIRELENVIARVVTLSQAPVISAEEFRVIFSLGGALSAELPSPPAVDSTGGTIQGAEKDAIVQALLAAEGNQTKAAKALGMGRNTLWRKMKKYEIDSRG
jgi:transcriptional regulator with PAS, ATPase and Fis domain